MVDAFESLRESLSDFCILNVPLPSDSYELHTDASGREVGSFFAHL